MYPDVLGLSLEDSKPLFEKLWAHLTSDRYKMVRIQWTQALQLSVTGANFAPFTIQTVYWEVSLITRCCGIYFIFILYSMNL